jgi:hypothetical protein
MRRGAGRCDRVTNMQGRRVFVWRRKWVSPPSAAVSGALWVTLTIGSRVVTSEYVDALGITAKSHKIFQNAISPKVAKNHSMARPPKDIFATDFRGSSEKNLRKNLWRHIIWQNPLLQYCRQCGGHPPFSATYHGGRHMATTAGKKWAKRPRHVMWQDRLRPCAVFTETSERFAPYYLAEIRHDLSQTTPTPKCRNLCVQHAFVEGKKVEKTSLRKSTPRTLKEVDQQYTEVF